MSNIDQQTADAKLAEAAKEYAKGRRSEEYYEGIIKSKAAEEYWQSQQSVKKIDRSKIKSIINDMIENGCYEIKLDNLISECQNPKE